MVSKKNFPSFPASSKPVGYIHHAYTVNNKNMCYIGVYVA